VLSFHAKPGLETLQSVAGRPPLRILLDLGYSLQEIKGISPTLCTHRIPLDSSITPSREPQRRLNNAMREVVNKEVLKLLHTGIIYPVLYSE